MKEYTIQQASEYTEADIRSERWRLTDIEMSRLATILRMGRWQGLTSDGLAREALCIAASQLEFSGPASGLLRRASERVLAALRWLDYSTGIRDASGGDK